MNTMFFNRSPLQALTILQNLRSTHIALTKYEDIVKTQGIHLSSVSNGHFVFALFASLGIAHKSLSNIVQSELVMIPTLSGGKRPVVYGEVKSGGNVDISEELSLLYGHFDSQEIVKLLRKYVIPTVQIRTAYDDGRELHVASMRAHEYLNSGGVLPEGFSMSADPNLAFLIAAVRMFINLFSLIAHTRLEFITASVDEDGAKEHSEHILGLLVEDEQAPETTKHVASFEKAGVAANVIEALTSLDNTSYMDFSSPDAINYEVAQKVIDDMFGVPSSKLN